ncbi:MAG: type 3 dihydrofolate reductase [bacterium]|nr:type 3 dihydrofolate reductase [bacterium]
MLSLIVAMDKNRLIGDSKKIPWHLPADFAYFKETTMGKPIIMGRTTFESIGRPLPGRKNIVLTRGSYSHEGILVAHSFEEARIIAGDSDEIFVIGGAQVYKEALPFVDRLYVTFVEEEFEGNIFFPEVDFTEWREIKNETRKADEKNLHAMRFAVFERAQA